MASPPTDPKDAQVYAQLLKVRESKTLSLKPTPTLRTELEGPDGTPQPFNLRYYQSQGIFHLLMCRRMVLGDSTGLGKTIQAIGAMCYLWDKDPDIKVLVTCPKSALRQWAGEVDKFTTGVKTFIATGSFPQRKAAYEAWAKTPRSILVTNYHSLVRDWDAGGTPSEKGPAIKEGYLSALTKSMKLTVAFDECFDYHTPIVLADGSTALIGQVVSKQLPVEVLTWNFDTQRVEPKRVVNWYKNPFHEKVSGTLLKVSFKFGGRVNVTRSHDFYTRDGRTLKAFALKPGSEVAVLVRGAPTKDQEQIVLGGLLGDSSLSHPNRKQCGVCFGQSTKQETYLRFKRNALEPLGVSDLSYYQTEFQSNTQQMVRFRLNANPALMSTLDRARVWVEGRKRITADLLDHIGPLGLAVWYGDDGSIQEQYNEDGTLASRHIVLHTEGFSREENEILAGWLRWKWGVRAKVTKQKKRDRAPYYALYLNKAAAGKFLALMPGALPGVEYKFPGLQSLALSDLDLTPSQAVVPDTVESIEPWLPSPKPKLKTRYVYDIEVEDNHNYFANGVLVSNCTAFKTPTTKTHQVCKQVSERASRVWGLTATLLKNSLMEGFGIYKVIKPDVFGSKTAFMNDFCVVDVQKLRSGVRIPIIVGYKNLTQFRAVIDPYFYGRPKHMVSNELPALTSREVLCELSTHQDRKYEEALQGVLELGDGETRDYQETKALTSLIYCQEAVNSLALLRYKEGEHTELDELGAKEEALLDLLTGEFEDEKVIVYTRFESMVTRMSEILKKNKIKSARITGKENAVARKAAQDKFQDVKSDTKVIFITDAGSEAINLQAAGALVFYDSPWSWGNYCQIIGRLIRIGSTHQNVYAIHLVAERPGQKGKKRETIDHATIRALRKKKGFIDQIIGEAAVGALSFDRGESGIRDLLNDVVKSSAK